jgi:hypothetical protein
MNLDEEIKVEEHFEYIVAQISKEQEMKGNNIYELTEEGKLVEDKIKWHR